MAIAFQFFVIAIPDQGETMYRKVVEIAYPSGEAQANYSLNIHNFFDQWLEFDRFLAQAHPR
jgi:hypothetical protein